MVGRDRRGLLLLSTDRQSLKERGRRGNRGERAAGEALSLARLRKRGGA